MSKWCGHVRNDGGGGVSRDGAADRVGCPCEPGGKRLLAPREGFERSARQDPVLRHVVVGPVDVPLATTIHLGDRPVQPGLQRLQGGDAHETERGTPGHLRGRASVRVAGSGAPPGSRLGSAVTRSTAVQRPSPSSGGCHPAVPTQTPAQKLQALAWHGEPGV